ncbi:hypothetical protein BV898_14843 [Hypsibius exemplaris]|uniref:MD-2-related lipid-recognition domain-containing protein n=1 Tax=Hypsibius exemplaris TaxID=2072580 RepID=A0A9X6N9K4_HYPEX|nr:hypothetical protein BV898_14843 [Hypsibius exemplaris]
MASVPAVLLSTMLVSVAVAQLVLPENKVDQANERSLGGLGGLLGGGGLGGLLGGAGAGGGLGGLLGGGAGAAGGLGGALAGIKVQNVAYKSCGPTDIIKVNELKISPDLKLTASIELLEDLEAPISIQVSASKEIPWFGPKTFERSFSDVCSLPAVVARKEQCEAKAADLGLDIPCSCPIQAKTYAVKDFQLGKRLLGAAAGQRSIGSLFLKGKVSARAIIKANGKPVGCHDISATIV